MTARVPNTGRPPSLTRAAEGDYRPGPYLLSDGWLSAGAGKLLNWWQAGYSLQPYGVGSAMVEACVSAYSQTVAMCPGTHWRKVDDGGREPVTSSALSRILKRPNDYESMSDLLLNLTRKTYTKGEAYGLAIRNDRGEIKEIHRMREGSPVLAVDGSIFYRLWGNEIVEQRFDLSDPIPARDVLHIRLHTPRHPLRGESPILSVALDLALSGAALNQQTAFYLNQARPSFMLETEQQLTAQQTQDLRDRWDAQTKGDNAGGTPILAWGLKAKPVTTSASDGRLADLLKLSDQNVALAFRMPLQILGVGGTPFASTEALMSSWKSTGLGFILNHIEEAFGLLFKLGGQPDEYLEFDTDALLRSSFKEMIESLANASGKVMTKNEARAKIGLGRKDGGDEIYVQMQDIPLSMAGKVQQQALENTDKSNAAVDPVKTDGAEQVDLSDDEAAEAARSVLDAVFAEIAPIKLLPAPRIEDRAAPRTLYVRRDLLNGSDLVAWAKGQGFATTLEPDDMHVTITFSRRPVDWMKMGESWGGDANGELIIKPGGPRLVEKLGPSAVVLLFASAELSWRHDDMMVAGASFDFDRYQPHVTISYTGAPADLTQVEPYRGELRFGPEVFEELEEDWKSGVTEKSGSFQVERSPA